MINKLTPAPLNHLASLKPAPLASRHLSSFPSPIAAQLNAVPNACSSIHTVTAATNRAGGSLFRKKLSALVPLVEQPHGPRWQLLCLFLHVAVDRIWPLIVHDETLIRLADADAFGDRR